MSDTTTSLLPIPKIAAAGGIGVPLGVLIGWALDMPDPVAVAAGALVASLIGYLKSNDSYFLRRKRDAGTTQQ